MVLPPRLVGIRENSARETREKSHRRRVGGSSAPAPLASFNTVGHLTGQEAMQMKPYVKITSPPKRQYLTPIPTTCEELIMNLPSPPKRQALIPITCEELIKN